MHYYHREHSATRTMTTATMAAVAVLLTTAVGAASTGKDATAAAVGTSAAPPVAGLAAEPVAAESKKYAGKAMDVDGFVRTGSTKGDKGYDEQDTYGGGDADSYGFGTQVSFGSQGGDGGDGAYHETSSYDDNGRSNPKYSSWHFEDKDGKPTKRYVYDSHGNSKPKKYDPLAVKAEASEYDSVEAYDDPEEGGTHAGYETDEAEPEYGALYDSADVYNDADTYY